MRKSYALFMTVLLLVFSSISAQDETFTITLMHTNDTRTHHDPNSDGNGGVAIQAAVVKQIRAEVENSLLLDIGDRFAGSLYHTVYLGQDQVEIMNTLGYQAMVLGNHEFDNGDVVLTEFLLAVDFPALAANLDVSASAELDGLVQPYVVLEVGGQQIGVIGIITADTDHIASPGDALVFNPDYAGVANAAAAELTAQGVNKIILLTHLGYDVDQQIIPDLTGIDVMFGGHKHTLLSNQNTGSAGSYPMVFETNSGETIYYGQAGADNEYLGRMDVEFDANGVVVSAEGDSIFLSRYIAPDPDMNDLLAELGTEVAALTDQPAGITTDVPLNGDRRICRVEECAFGNLMADAMRFNTGAQIAIMNGGGIRSGIEAGEVTIGELLAVQPFGNLIASFELKGVDVLAMLENGVSRIVVGEGGVISRDDLNGRFPQVSGLRFSYDPTQPVGSRIVSAELINPDGTFSPIEPDTVYLVATNNFMRFGGDDYTMLRDNAINPYDYGAVDWEVTRAYLESISPITVDELALQGRITIVNATAAPLE